MRQVRKTFALLVGVFWLLATQHCGLEAAGVWPSDGHAVNCCAGSDHCTSDGCTIVETGAYKPANMSLQIAAPALATCLCLLCVVHAAPPPEAALIVPAAEWRPHDWVPTWQFVQRAAPSPRAPSLA